MKANEEEEIKVFIAFDRVIVRSLIKFQYLSLPKHMAFCFLSFFLCKALLNIYVYCIEAALYKTIISIIIIGCG